MHVLATGRTEKRATFYALGHGPILADLRTPCDILTAAVQGVHFDVIWRQWRLKG